jgi:hypothetical protein
MWPIVITHLRNSPSALRSVALAFIACGPSVCDHREFVSKLETDLRNSPFFALRRFYINAVLAVILLLPISFFNDELWPNVVSLVEDPVPAVRAALLQSLKNFRKTFAALGLAALEQHLFGVIAILAHDEDPFVNSVWSEIPEGSLDDRAIPVPDFHKNARSSHLLSVLPRLEGKPKMASSTGRTTGLKMVTSLDNFDKFRKVSSTGGTSHLPLIYSRPRITVPSKI